MGEDDDDEDDEENDAVSELGPMPKQLKKKLDTYFKDDENVELWNSNYVKLESKMKTKMTQMDLRRFCKATKLKLSFKEEKEFKTYFIGSKKNIVNLKLCNDIYGNKEDDSSETTKSKKSKKKSKKKKKKEEDDDVDSPSELKDDEEEDEEEEEDQASKSKKSKK